MPAPTLLTKTDCRRSRAFGKDPGPGRFLMMVCDAAQRFLLAAEPALVSGRRPSAAANIVRAQSILVEMMGSVDRAVLPDLADAHTRICQNLIDRLSEALVTGDVSRVRQVRGLLLGFQDAWAGATGTPGRALAGVQALAEAPAPFALETSLAPWRGQAACGESCPAVSLSSLLYSTSEYT